MMPPTNDQDPQGDGRPNGGGFDGGRDDHEKRGQIQTMEVSKEFLISAGGNYFTSVGAEKYG